MYRIYKTCIDVDLLSAPYLRGCLYDLDGDGSEGELAQRLEAVECQLERRLDDDDRVVTLRLSAGEHAALVAALALREERESRESVSFQGNR